MEISSWFFDNWQNLSSIIAFLGVGYTVTRKFESILGKDSKGRTIADRLDVVEHQLFPNGGTSLADKVNCLAQNDIEIKQDLKQLSGELKVVHDVLIAYISDKK